MHIIWNDTSDTRAYDEVCWANVFNLRRPKHRRPRGVTKARCDEDILAAVERAIQLGLRIAVRSGGHSFEAWSIQDNAIMVNLCEYKQVKVDTARRTATATSSVTSIELNEILAQDGLFFPGGHCPDVGLGGFLLQGGMGWNCGNWGWACELVQGIDVITAEGKPVYCDITQNSDLFWAARGAGPAFPGIVTRFHLRVMPCPQSIYSSCYIFPHALYATAFRWAITLVDDLDTDTELTAKAYHQDSGPCFSIIITTFKHNFQDAMQALQTVHESRPAGTLSECFCFPESMSSLYAALASINPEGHRYSTDNGFFHDDPNIDLVFNLEEAFLTLPHESSYAFWAPMRPWSRRNIAEMALSLQGDHYFAVYTIWEDEKDDQRCQEWLRRTMKRALKSSIGSYIGDSEFSHRDARYWRDQNTERLMEIRRKWDPQSRIAGGYPSTLALPNGRASVIEELSRLDDQHM
ncbi:unnamed protein product [Penicillium olsonii]|nr:unnamed protein product [Penicillium olsonii]CAG7931110.1 unnamed protein product [Penicillium olsonii]